MGWNHIMYERCVRVRRELEAAIFHLGQAQREAWTPTCGAPADLKPDDPQLDHEIEKVVAAAKAVIEPYLLVIETHRPRHLKNALKED